MHKNGKILTISELRSEYRRYQKQDPESMQVLISSLKIEEIQGENFDKYFNNYINSKALLYKVLTGENNQKEIKDKIYDYLSFIVLIYQNFEKYKYESDYNIQSLELDCNRCLKIGYYDELLVLKKHNIINIFDFYISIINKSIYDILDCKTVFVFLIIINDFINTDIITIPELVYKESIKMKKEMEENNYNFVSLYNVEDYSSEVVWGRQLFKITFLSFPTVNYYDIFVIFNSIKHTYEISYKNYVSSLIFKSETELKKCIEDAIYKFFNFEDRRSNRKCRANIGVEENNE